MIAKNIPERMQRKYARLFQEEKLTIQDIMMQTGLSHRTVQRMLGQYGVLPPKRPYDMTKRNQKKFQQQREFALANVPLPTPQMAVNTNALSGLSMYQPTVIYPTTLLQRVIYSIKKFFGWA